MSEIASASFISSVGFPIFACIYIYLQNQKLNEMIQEQNKMHTQEMLLFKDAIDNNTKAINDLTIKLKVKE